MRSLKAFVNFSHEVSVIAARSVDGQVSCYDPGENVHRDGILDTTTVPARLMPARRMDAVLMAGKILNALDYVGVMGVELFVTPQALVVNEIAPRVHNSGHWTQNGCAVDQFEQHIRAVVGMAAGRWAAPFGCGDGKPDRRRCGPPARARPRARLRDPYVRQGRGQARPQNGPCQPGITKAQAAQK